MADEANEIEQANPANGVQRRTPPGRRSVVRARVEELTRILLDGAMATLDVEAYIREQEAQPDSPWFLRDGQKPLHYASIRRYIVRAEENIARIAEEDHDKLFGRHIAQRRALFQKAVAMGDLRCALSVLQDEAQLYGLYPARRTEVTGKDGAPISLAVLVAAVQQAEKENIPAVAQAGPQPPALEAPAHLAIFEGGNYDAQEADHQREAGQCGDAPPVGGNQKVP